MGGASRLTRAEQARVNSVVSEAVEKYRALGRTAPASLLAMEKATRAAQSPMTGMLGLLRGLGPAIGGAFSATAVIGFARAALDAADSLEKLHDQTGISFQGLQRLQRAGDDAGNSIEDITSAVSQMQRRLAEAKPGDDFSRALEQLGIDIEAFRQLDPASQFMAIGDALQGIEVPALRTDLAMRTMGRTGAQVLPTLTRGFDDLRNHAVGMSDDTIRALGQIGDELMALLRTVKDAGANLFVGVLDAISPVDALIRREAMLAKQLDEMVKSRQGKAPLALPPQTVPTLSTGEADRIARELDEKVRALIADEQKLAQVTARAFGLDTIENAREMMKAIGGMSGLVRMDNEQLKALNSLMTAAIEAAQRNGRDVPLEWLRVEEATRANVQTLSEYLRTVQELPAAMREIPEPPQLIPFTSELDIERTRKLLAQNAPGTGIHEAAKEAGESIGRDIRDGVAQEFDRVPHMIATAIVHQAGFKRTLAAIGADIGTTIAEELIKGLIKKLIAAKLAEQIADAVGNGSPGGGGGGGGNGGGDPWWKQLLKGFTNPLALGVAGAIALGKGISHLVHRGDKTNDARDKFLGQFAAFDNKRDDQNPPGFYGADLLLSKYKHHDLFSALVAARNLGDLRKREDEIIAVLQQATGRTFKRFNLGGFVPPGAVQAGILHGGARGELAAPIGTLASEISAALRQRMGAMSIPPLQMPMLAPVGPMSTLMPVAPATRVAPPIIQHYTINVNASSMDPDGMQKVFDREILPRLQHEFRYNNNRLASVVKRAIKE
jgi:hypothetical protein